VSFGSVAAIELTRFLWLSLANLENIKVMWTCIWWEYVWSVDWSRSHAFRRCKVKDGLKIQEREKKRTQITCFIAVVCLFLDVYIRLHGALQSSRCLGKPV